MESKAVLHELTRSGWLVQRNHHYCPLMFEMAMGSDLVGAFSTPPSRENSRPFIGFALRGQLLRILAEGLKARENRRMTRSDHNSKISGAMATPSKNKSCPRRVGGHSFRIS